MVVDWIKVVELMNYFVIIENVLSINVLSIVVYCKYNNEVEVIILILRLIIWILKMLNV